MLPGTAAAPTAADWSATTSTPSPILTLRATAVAAATAADWSASTASAATSTTPTPPATTHASNTVATAAGWSATTPVLSPTLMPSGIAAATPTVDWSAVIYTAASPAPTACRPQALLSARQSPYPICARQHRSAAGRLAYGTSAQHHSCRPCGICRSAPRASQATHPAVGSRHTIRPEHPHRRQTHKTPMVTASPIIVTTARLHQTTIKRITTVPPPVMHVRIPIMIAA